jgi:hypothetical protein
MNPESTIQKNAPLAETGRIRSFRPPIWGKFFAGSRFLTEKFLRPMLIGFLLILAAGCHWPTGHTFIVTNDMDYHDTNPGDGQCQIASGQGCTLRAAIEEANAIHGADKIHFNIPPEPAIHNNGGFPVITEDLEIDGRTQSGYIDEPLIDVDLLSCPAGPCDLFTIASGVPVAVWGLRINGAPQRYAFYSEGDLRLEKMRITMPVFSRGLGGLAKLTVVSSELGWSGSKPSIEAENSTVSISSSTIHHSSTQDPATEAGGVVIRGGTATITETEIKENTGWKSGGMYIDGAEVHLSQTSVTENTGWDAGGIYVESNSELWVDGSWIDENAAAIISDGDKFGGGIYSEGKVHISHSIVEDNSGAGIHSRGVGGNATLEITNNQIMNNSLAGIYATQTDMDITDSQIQYNENGGIFLAKGSLTVTGSSVSGNQNNGGIHVEAANLLVNKSTISGNTNSDKGGGLYLYATLGTVEIVNTTISGNQAVHDGGGISIIGVIVELNNVTVTLNSAGHGAGLWNGFGTLRVINTIVADNSGGNCDGTITSGGHNLDTRDTCGFSGAGDISNMNAGLGPLQDNGGGTETHALPNDSPALEAGDDPTCQKTDQRGVSRPQGLHCDMGAFEAENPVTATPPSVTWTSRPSRTPTSTLTLTDTPTATAQKFLFDPVNFSTDLIYSGSGRTCTPREVTIQVRVSPSELATTLGLFYRLVEKEGTNVTPWSAGFSMTPQGGGWYTLTLYGEDFPDTSKWGHDAWLEIQFVANGKDGQPIARSDVYRRVTLGRCLTRSG